MESKPKNIFFWQPKHDLLKIFLGLNFGKYLIVILNYIIWIFLFFISFLLVKKNINIFWQLLVAAVISELIEKIVKKNIYWKRPLYLKRDKTPVGLLDRWYKTGSFPSGHTIKAVYFLFFVLQYQVFNPIAFILIIFPLLLFRIVIGFHYPIDMLGGTVIGFLTWFFSKNIIFPEIFNNIAQIIFNFVFLIK